MININTLIVTRNAEGDEIDQASDTDYTAGGGTPDYFEKGHTKEYSIFFDGTPHQARYWLAALRYAGIN